ncbi:hypothetical protein MUN82_12460 [Hymenobacter aerilatus]|uniref:Uncharacterized protein n=1 Tax=Hymenobacter aerilatus TaxID=2932251 RepID=A0A8T9SVG6_9BACT|nr:hypothetical protein [Hymenobacter aerilatus]UOR03759.1 hypothetical protein MUN82_12460 [Hymenobacter aerilatus]
MADSANNTPDNQPMSEEQRKHHEELYSYKKDDEGTLDTSDMLDEASNGLPDTPTAGPDPDTSSQTDELLSPGFNNPIDDNNR